MDVCVGVFTTGRKTGTLTSQWVGGTGSAPSQAVRSREHGAPCQSCPGSSSVAVVLSTAQSKNTQRGVTASPVPGCT